jgi:hypothetical protein
MITSLIKPQNLNNSEEKLNNLLDKINYTPESEASTQNTDIGGPNTNDAKGTLHLNETISSRLA